MRVWMRCAHLDDADCVLGLRLKNVDKVPLVVIADDDGVAYSQARVAAERLFKDCPVIADVEEVLAVRAQLYEGRRSQSDILEVNDISLLEQQVLHHLRTKEEAQTRVSMTPREHR